MADKKGPWERLGDSKWDKAATGADAALAGFQAGQTEGNLDDLLGLGIAFAQGGPVGATIFAVSSLFGRRKRKEERRKQQRIASRRVIDLQPRDSIALPYVYGRFRVDAVPVFAAVGGSIPAHATAYQSIGKRKLFGRMYGYDGTGAFAGVQGNEGTSAMLLAQSDIAAGHVSEIYDVLFRGRSLKDDADMRRYAMARLGVPGVADQMATIFTPTNRGLQRNANSKFTGKSYLTHLHFQDYRNPQWDAEIPQPEVIGRGADVRTIEADAQGNATGESAALTATSNPIRIGVDLLRYKQGVPLDEFDLQSVYNAQQAIKDVSGIAARSDAHAKKVVLRNGEVYVVDDTGLTERQQFMRYGFIPEGSLDAIIGTGLSTQTVLGGNQAPTLRYEFDGEIPSDLTIEDAVELVWETIPGLIYYRNKDNKLAFSVPDSETDEADQSVGTLTDAVNGGSVVRLVSYGSPLEEDKVSSLTARFKNVNEDLRESSLVFPKPGSSLESQLKAIEGDLLRGEVDLEGIVNPYLAHSAAVNFILMSHRDTGQVICSPHDYKYEPGDVVRLTLTEEGIDDWVRIMDRTETSDNLSITYDVMQFNKGDYAYIPDSKQEVVLPDAPDLSLVVPTNVAAVQEGGDAHITWEGGNTNTAGYEIEMQYGATDTIRAAAGWIPIGNVPAISAKAFVQSLFTGEFSYRFRVRSTGHGGGVSAFAMSPVYKFKRTVPVSVDTLLEKPPPPVLAGRDQSIEATWLMVAGVSYQLEFRLLADKWPADTSEYTAATSPFLKTGLVNGSSYVARIRKWADDVRKSDWSDDSAAATPSGLLIPDLTLLPITSAGILDKVLATWTASPGATRYCVRTRLASQQNIVDKVKVEDSTSVTLGRHWLAGSRYAVQVEAENQDTGEKSGYSPWVEITVPVKEETHKPNIPRDGDRVIGKSIDSYSVDYDSLTIVVKAPLANDSYGRAERIEYQYRKAGAAAYSDWFTYPTGLTPLGTSRLAAAYDEGDARVNSQTYRLHLTNLDHDTAYDFRLRAANAVGESAVVDVAGIRTEGLRRSGETAYWRQAERTPAPSTPTGGTPRYSTYASTDGPIVGWPSRPSWIPVWAASTAYDSHIPPGTHPGFASPFIGDLVRLTTGTHTRYMECEETHTSVAGGLTLSASGVLGGTQLAKWREAHWAIGGSDPVDNANYWWRTSRGLTYAPTWFVGVRNNAFRSTQAFASGSAAPTGTSGKWYLQTGTSPALWYLNGTAWVRILDSVTYGADEPTASTGDVYVQTGTWIVWRHIAYQKWVRVVDPRSLFGTAAGIRTVGGEKYATVRSTDALDDYLDDSTVNQVLHLSARDVSDGVLVGIFYAKGYRDKASSLISSLPVAAEGQAFEFTTATQAGGVVTIEARPKSGNTAGARQTMRRFFEADHAAKVGDWQALFADAATSTDTGAAWRWTFTGVAAGTVAPTATLEIVEAVFVRYSVDDADDSIHMVYFESRTWGTPVNYRVPPPAAPVIQTASGTYRLIPGGNYQFDLQCTATGGVAPYAYAWAIYGRDVDGTASTAPIATGNGRAISLQGALDPSHIPPTGQAPTAVITVTDSSNPVKTATRTIVLTSA